MTQDYSFALKNTIMEIKKAEPFLQNIFIFQKDGQVIAKDETSEESIKTLYAAFNELTRRADFVDSLENLAVEGDNIQVNVSCLNDFYVATVCSKETDKKMLKALTQILVPTVMKIVDNITPPAMEPEPAEISPKELFEEITSSKKQRSIVPTPQAKQLIVEKIGGLLNPSDTVRIGKKIIDDWVNIYGDGIQEVNVETMSGHSEKCKFRPNRDLKQACSGTILITEKIMANLKISKGDLVTVKPVVTCLEA
jgi:hypothetical protein